MFRTLRELSDRGAALVAVMDKISKLLAIQIEESLETGDHGDRLDALERSRATWEAEMEAVGMRAGSTLKAARSAEERTRSMVKVADEVDDGNSDGEAEIRRALEEYNLSIRDAETGEAKGLPAVYNDVETRSTKAAMMAKFGYR